MTPKSKLQYSILALLGTITLGTIGFKVLTSWTWFTCFYFTLITVTTIGFGEPPEMTEAAYYFTVVIILTGVAIVGYTASILVQTILSLELIASIEKRRMRKEIHSLNKHYIICGAGRVGLRVVREITKRKMDYLIVENDEQVATNLVQQGFRVLEGDATQDEVLREAGIERAAGLICAVSSDPENLYITLTARDINKDVFIVARANDESAVPRLLKVGANKVVSPVITGSHQMAQFLVKPLVADFLELATMVEEHNLAIEQIYITPGSELHNQTLQATHIRTQLNVMVIGIKRLSGEMLFNPSADTIIETGDAMIVMGDREGMQRLENMAGAG